jgi:concanavalin A-like lectin/glucanase superfamily protein
MSRTSWGLACLLLALVAGCDRSASPTPTTPPPTIAAGGLLAVAQPVSAAPSAPGTIGVAPGPITVRYTFDGGIHQPITDLAGEHRLRALGENGGALRLVPEGPGLAVSYPARCHLPSEQDCPRAILEGVRDDRLNPGTRFLQYGASVRMTTADLADGANVVQKGYSVGGVTQYKLQIDHYLGRPSCVLVGKSRTISRAEPTRNVADGRWHNLMCTRSRDRLTMTIDGLEETSVQVPPTLSIANPEPLRIGGKGAATGNDQFAGEIDNVFVTIG